VSQHSPLAVPLTITYGAPTTSAGTPPTSVSCVPVSGSAFPVGSTTVTCTETDDVKRTDVCTFAVTVTGPPFLLANATSFLAFGDSITWGEDGTIAATADAGRVHLRVQLPAPETYPGALQADLSGLYTAQTPKVQNAGLPGEAITMSSTFPRLVSYTSTGLYNVLLLMEGANDLANQSNSPAIAGLGRMIDDAKGRQMRVFLATIPPENPAGCCPDRGVESGLVAPFNDQVRALAAAKGVPLVDIYQAFGGNLALLGFDGLHPNPGGYQLIANTFLAAIRQNLEVPSVSSVPTRTLRLLAPPGRR
jgi:lysophospholipase L1-like esterase